MTSLSRAKSLLRIYAPKVASGPEKSDAEADGLHFGGRFPLRDCLNHHRSFHRHSSSASRFTAGASQFLNLSQSSERPGRAAAHYPHKQNPADAGSCQAHRTAGDRGDRGYPSAPWNVRRASSGNVFVFNFCSAPECTVFAAARSLRAMAPIVSLPFFRRPDHTHHVGAGRALVCDQPILVLQRQDFCHFPQCVLAPGARRRPCLLRASATIKPLRKQP